MQYLSNLRRKVVAKEEEMPIKSGNCPRHYTKTPEEDLKIIRRVLRREIINVRGWCVRFGQMGSKVCQRVADERGWHKGSWRKGWAKAIFTDEERLERRRQQSREWGARNKERVRAHNARKKKEELEWTGRVGTH